MSDPSVDPMQALRVAMRLPDGSPESSRGWELMRKTYQRSLEQLKHKAEQERAILEASTQKLLDEQVCWFFFCVCVWAYVSSLAPMKISVTVLLSPTTEVEERH